MERKWWTLVAVCGGVFMLLLDITIVNVALPDIERELDASFSDLQWVIDAYALTLAALLLTAGSLADRFGRKLLFAIGIVIFTLGSLLCGVAGSPLVLTLSRAGQGIGGAIMFATALALLSNAFRGRDRGAAFGAFGATTGVAVAVGPVLGGALTSGLSWRWIFFVNLPVGIAALAVTLLRVEESRDPRAAAARLDRLLHASAPASACWCSRSSAATSRAGARRRSSAAWSPPPCCWRRSSSPSGCRRARCSTSRCCASRPSSAA